MVSKGQENDMRGGIQRLPESSSYLSQIEPLPVRFLDF